jgi:hypothetical protein
LTAKPLISPKPVKGTRPMEKIYLHEYKQGIADALLIGAMRETHSYEYKQGYDFGLTLYSDLLEQEEKE